jgi:hypothetical protein
MPAFGKVLTREQIAKVTAYLRTLCSESDWPLGELNVPRALITEKAFPESEAVLTSSITTKGTPGISNEFVYERTLNRGNQLEVAVPIDWVHQDAGGVRGGVGDVALGLKHVLFSHVDRDEAEPLFPTTGSILSVQGELVLPTGNVEEGLGTGKTALGVFVAYDRLLPAQMFLQVQSGVELPIHHTEEVPNAAYLRTALGRSFASDSGFGRMWTPMIEFIGDRDLKSGASTDWDVIPEFQVTLSQRQHVRAALGYRTPLNHTKGRPHELVFYVLWDWFDGSLLEGW